MSLSETLIKVGGIVLFIVGLLLIVQGAEQVGVSWETWIRPIIGIVMIGLGIYVVRGGTPTL